MKLGASNLTIGRFGCTTTAISMISDYFGCYTLPLQIAMNKAFYQTDGLIIWNKLDFPCFRFERREYGRNDDEIRKALADPNRAVILEVANKSHWVVAIGKYLFGNGYKIADPWNGAKTTTAAYKESVTGAAYFKRS